MHWVQPVSLTDPAGPLQPDGWSLESQHTRPLPQTHAPDELQVRPVGHEQEVTPVHSTSNAPGQVLPAPHDSVTGDVPPAPVPGHGLPPNAGAGHSQEPYKVLGPLPEGQVTGHQAPLIGLGFLPMMAWVTEL